MNVFVAVFAAICAGVVFLTSYRNSYVRVFNNQLDGVSTTNFNVTGGMLWASFVREREREKRNSFVIYIILLNCRAFPSVPCIK